MNPNLLCGVLLCIGGVGIVNNAVASHTYAELARTARGKPCDTMRHNAAVPKFFC